MDYYAITINITLGVLTWKDIHDALFKFFFFLKMKTITQNRTPFLVLGKKRKLTEGREKKREWRELWAPKV